MYAANSSILYSKDKTVRILDTLCQYLVNVSCLRYSKQIEFQEELINFLRTWLLEVSSRFLYKTVFLKISHITYPFLSSTNFTAQ